MKAEVHKSGESLIIYPENSTECYAIRAITTKAPDADLVEITVDESLVSSISMGLGFRKKV